MSETEAKPVQETKKKKYVKTKDDIAKSKKKRLMRKRLLRFLKPINWDAIKAQVRSPFFTTEIRRQSREHERRKMIFNLLVKSWFSSQKITKIRSKFGYTRKGSELFDKIDITFNNKYDFTIRGLDMDKQWGKHFKNIITKQFNDHRPLKEQTKPRRTVTQTKRNRFILEREFQ